jgi:hypothetical protein
MPKLRVSNFSGFAVHKYCYQAAFEYLTLENRNRTTAHKNILYIQVVNLSIHVTTRRFC